MSRVAVGVVIGQSYRGPSSDLTLLTCSFGKRVVPKGNLGESARTMKTWFAKRGGS